MKLLVIGSGGREHALVWKLAQSPHVTQMWCAPGNAGIAQERLAKNQSTMECVNIGAEDFPKLLDFAKEKKIDLTVVGPDNPLALGIVDLFQKHGLKIWGPNQKAAQFEASKVFSQDFMEKYGIPTAKAGTFSNVAMAKGFAESLGGRCAVKADGLALGKGVLICSSTAEANRAIDEILVNKAFGIAGAKVVIQEFLEGPEISLHALCDGKTAKLFPTAQDHKRALDGDQGLNTGGMGTYSPAPFLSDAELGAVGKSILDPWLKGCAAEGIDFHGILYPGVMLTKNGPKVLEFNARFGDPEAQVYLTRLENDLVELLDASASGNLDRIELKWSLMSSVCVVMASGGYPGSYAKGKIIAGLTEAGQLPHTKVFHAGTTMAGEEVVTNGGRVLGVTAWAKDLSAAKAAAYLAVEKIAFDGAQFRRDIAAKALG
ncbi:phosphoribosylamine--glycine ligase [Pedosphaera parvula]|uniref:Phosphoribosylamine--glycine ligase n=1 Tax=Pedosphaera parvula (strain Ellin514) TaxID=320771 RepID=B9XPG5_PEDPL|nr:phosphoribosylamine--glycine ligase [Pedosphaera parvula]EEF58305.1 phosphoribosylamine/glycine ligase [Pedosphaera parvula Ellin514]